MISRIRGVPQNRLGMGLMDELEDDYCPVCHCDYYVTPRDPNDEGAYPGPDLDCECECH